MSGTIIIEDLRNIARLQFDLPESGVWLLTGGNGSGKTSLLACLRQIGNSNAFPTHFPSSIKSTQLDNYETAKIVYKINDEEVEYAYRGERWAPRPRKNSHLLGDFGYPKVLYIGANAERITARPDDFRPARAQNAPTNLVAAANSIFETKKFNTLKVVNLTTGPGNKAFVLKVRDTPASYHSEKQFSLGELCILKLISALSSCPNHSLVLIDELEMALHPRAQSQLYNYLCKIAKDKKLTVIFSTHSVSLLKSASRKNTIYLQRDDDNNVIPIVGCFPTYAIGNITIGEERAPDVVLYVEDEVARSIVEPLIKLIITEKFSDDRLFPTVKIVPIGGYEQVVRFLIHHNSLLPPSTKSYVFLDKDVEVETVTEWKRNENHERLNWLSKVKEKVNYLPWTPEVGIISYICNHRKDAEIKLRAAISDNGFTITEDKFEAFNSSSGKDKRDKAKTIHREICSSIASLSAKDNEQSTRILSEVFARHYFKLNRSDALRLFGSKLV